MVNNFIYNNEILKWIGKEVYVVLPNKQPIKITVYGVEKNENKIYYFIDNEKKDKICVNELLFISEVDEYERLKTFVKAII